MPQLLASHSFLDLYLHEGARRALEARWKGYVSGVFLRQALLDALTLAREHGVTAWIADERKLGPVRPNDLEWVGSYVMRELVGMGLTRLARIEAADPLNQFLISEQVKVAQQQLPFEVGVFDNIDDAAAWACGE